MKKRFLRDGMDTMEPHELLEMILYYAIPRGDTNCIAHRLLSKFGSVREVLSANTDLLVQVEGVGPGVATYLKLMGALLHVAAMEDRELFVRYTKIQQIGNYLVPLFVGRSYELMYAMFFDDKMRLLGCEKLCEGTVNSATLNLRTLSKLVIKYDASAVVLAHNHPSGLTVPSSEDLNLTSALENFLSSIDTTLVEHLIVAGNRFAPIMATNRLYARSPLLPIEQPERKEYTV